jgi:hypothetical protein
MSLAPPTHAVADIARPCVNFRPSIWGDIFLQYDSELLVLYLICICKIFYVHI